MNQLMLVNIPHTHIYTNRITAHNHVYSTCTLYVCNASGDRKSGLLNTNILYNTCTMCHIQLS